MPLKPIWYNLSAMNSCWRQSNARERSKKIPHRRQIQDSFKEGGPTASNSYENYIEEIVQNIDVFFPFFNMNCFGRRRSIIAQGGRARHLLWNAPADILAFICRNKLVDTNWIIIILYFIIRTQTTNYPPKNKLLEIDGFHLSFPAVVYHHLSKPTESGS